MIKNLSALRRRERKEIVLASLPETISISSYAMARAFKINELVRLIHRNSYEWYGFTIAAVSEPEVVIDIGLPQNDDNVHYHTGIDPERIALFRESLPPDKVINGWIHSHGNLGLRQFSSTDARNHITVLHYVTASLRKPVAKREVAIKDLKLLVEDRYRDQDLEEGAVNLITDSPVSEATIMEAVYGGFSYGIVIGDEGWSEQEIHTIRRGILTGHTTVDKKRADLELTDGERSLTESEIEALAEEVRAKIRLLRAPNLGAGL
jgi:hypothetical protein